MLNKKNITKYLFVISIFCVNLCLGCSNINNKNRIQFAKQPYRYHNSVKKMKDKIYNSKIYDCIGKDQVEEDELVFTINPIDEEIKDRIVGVSWKEDCPIKLEDLSYLNITYLGFDEQKHIGEMIVHNKVAEEVLDIFKELYQNKFPIEKMNLIDEYEADDNKSMADNNTSAFCYRTMSGGKYISKHGYGIAIDINPLINPYKKGNIILPEEGKDFLDRNKEHIGMIHKKDICYKAFIKRGWTWGGDWKSPKDFQHFEKDLSCIND